MIRQFQLLMLTAGLLCCTREISFAADETAPSSDTPAPSSEPGVTSGEATEARDPAATRRRRVTPTKAPGRSSGQRLVSGITVQGNKRIETTAVLEKMSLRPGQPFSSDALAKDIRAIFDLGVFDEIEVHEGASSGSQMALIVKVKERPVISEVVYEGLDNLEADDFKDAVNLKKYMVFNPAAASESAIKIREVYEGKGFYLAAVTFEARPVGGAENEVDLVFKVQENDRIRVKKINFLGNAVFPDSDLKKIMQTQEGGVLSFLTDSGNFKETAFERDVQILSYWYYNNGYVQVEVGKPQVYVSPDKRWIYITVPIKEGEQFNIGEIKFAGELLFPEGELREELKIESGETFSSDKLREQVLHYTAKYGDLGYAFANVVPQHEVHPETKLIDITFSIEKGEKVNIGRVSVTGNSRTHDKVLRRELRILEGELYNETNLRKSREGVERLGFFERGVAFNKVIRPGTKDILDINIVVKERHTGTLTIGAGYSSADSFIANAQIAEENFMGYGQRLAFYGFYSKNASRFNLSFDEPYFWDTNWSVGGDLYRANRDVFSNVGSALVQSYSELKFGSNLRVGHPIAEYVRAFLSYKIEHVEISNEFNPAIFSDPVNEGFTSSMTATVVRDTRDNRLEPTDGSNQSISAEVAGLGGSRYFAKIDVFNRWFLPLFWKFVLRTNVEYGFIAPIAGHNLPISERYVLGGVNSLRGYQNLSVGSLVCSSYSGTRTLTFSGPCPAGTFPFVVGGRHKLLANAEIEFPIFQEVGIKGVFFFDAGNSFDSFERPGSLTDVTNPFTEGPAIRANWGFGFRWFSPIGPLRFEFGFPMTAPLGGTREMQFQFMIGPSF